MWGETVKNGFDVAGSWIFWLVQDGGFKAPR
jgi:hypothetical protein